MKCAIFEEHSSSCVVYFRFSGTLFPVSMIDGDYGKNLSVKRVTIAYENNKDTLMSKHMSFFGLITLEHVQ